MRFRRLGICAFVLAVSSASAPSAGAQLVPPLGVPELPVDVPLPTEITADDLTSTSSEDGDFSGTFPAANACRSAARREISLPADDRPHNRSYIEWWWWRGSLKAPNGRRFAFTVTFASKPWTGLYAADFTLTDLGASSFHYDREPVIIGPPKSTGNGSRLVGEHVSAVGGAGRDTLRFDVDGYEVELKVKPRKPPVRQLGDGHITVYCNEASFYSRVGSGVRGTIRRGSEALAVTGTTTFDHMWGFSPGIELASWDWLNFELDDGRHLFLVVVHAARGSEENTLYSGSLSAADGTVTPLRRGDFSITPTRFWTRDATCSYPVEWDVDVLGERLHVRPSLDSTEVRAIDDPAAFLLWPVYWDGETVIDGDATGRGWMDMKYCYV